MAKFCTQCGRRLEEGEICECQKKVVPPEEPQRESQGEDSKDKSSFFEYDKNIVPDLVEAAENEIPVKQYNVCNANKFWGFLKQNGKLQITNQRVLFRMSGRTWLGKGIKQMEFDIHEVAGISLSEGRKLSFATVLLNLCIGSILTIIGNRIGRGSTFLALLLALLFAAISAFCAVEKYYKAAWIIGAIAHGIAVVKVVEVAYGMEVFTAAIAGIIGLATFLVFLYACFMDALKKSMSIEILTKNASGAPIRVFTRSIFQQFVELIPGPDADLAVKEVGALIRDVQSMEESRLKKWKVK